MSRQNHPTFLRGNPGRCKRQQVSNGRILLAEPRDSYASYDDVVHAARAAGYVYEAAQDRLKHLRDDASPRG